MGSKVVTFYSYKGGVGRSFCLANIAVILSQWGFRVVVIDFDLEAPGLHFYFRTSKSAPDHGLIDFLENCRLQKSTDLIEYIQNSSLNVDLIPVCNRISARYAKRVQDIDWDYMFEEANFSSLFEESIENLKKSYDFILVDSRTGLTDFTALLTSDIPDILVALMAANEQSMAGSLDIARRSTKARARSTIDKAALLVIPLLARFDDSEEYDHSKKWMDKFTRRIGTQIKLWLPPGTRAREISSHLRVPYIARWSFGEEIAAVSEIAGAGGVRNSSAPISYSLETISALIANEMGEIDLLTSRRDEYVHRARSVAKERTTSRLSKSLSEISEPYKIFVSTNIQLGSRGKDKDRNFFRAVLHELEREGVEFLRMSDNVQPGDEWTERTEELIYQSDAYLLIISGDTRAQIRRYHELEVEYFIRSSFRSNYQKPIFIYVSGELEHEIDRSFLGKINHEIITHENSQPKYEVSKIIRKISMMKKKNYDK